MEFLYSGSGGIETARSLYRIANNPPQSRNFTLDGTGVDIVQTEFTPWLHYEYFDRDGNFRVQLIDWYDEIGESEKSQPSLLYRNITDSTVNHGGMTLSLAAGLVGGLAKNARIYYMPTHISKFSGGNYNSSFAFYEGMRVLKKWHQNKPIDPKTGYKRPTLVINSVHLALNLYSKILYYPTPEISPGS